MSNKFDQDVSDEMLMAHADGELSDRDTKFLDARIARDPELQARYAEFSETRTVLRAALSPGDVPKRLIQAAQSSAIVHNGTSWYSGRKLAWPLSLAATIILGIGLGWTLSGSKDASASLGFPDVAKSVATVTTGQSHTLSDGRTVRVLGTFETNRGLCRLVSIVSANSLETRFVACHGDGRWQTAMSISNEFSVDFTPASDDAVELVDRFLDEISSGPPLEIEEERSALRAIASR